MQKFPVNELQEWFLEVKRDFPWREDLGPYAVWVSEVMLQQTQASVVVPYFLNWIRLFPDVKALAEAPLEAVIKAWEGLGYYSRARNLHEGAAFIVAHFDGVFPSQEEDLKKIKGLGPYTIGAILSFAFHKKKAAVDANVARVISRYFLIQEDVTSLKTLAHIRFLVESLLPNEDPHIAMEALIELGALVCKKKANCFSCPLKGDCLAFQANKTEEIPILKPKGQTIALFRSVAILKWEDFFLLRKEEGKKVMAGLYEFPYVESKNLGVQDIEAVFGLKGAFHSHLSPVSHTFTKYKAHLIPSLWNVLEKRDKKGYLWVKFKDLEKLPFSSGHRKILHQLKHEV